MQHRWQTVLTLVVSSAWTAAALASADGGAQGNARGNRPPETNTISIVNSVPLNFGSLVAGPTPGTVTLTARGERRTTGVYGLGLRGPAPGSFEVLRTGNLNTMLSIAWPDRVTLVNEHGQRMTIDTFVDEAAGLGRANQTYTIGATLHVDANQPAGTYSGVMRVTVSLGG